MPPTSPSQHNVPGPLSPVERSTLSHRTIVGIAPRAHVFAQVSQASLCLSHPGAEALCWHEFTFFLELSAYRQPERVAQFSPDWLHWTGFQAQNDDLIVK